MGKKSKKVSTTSKTVYGNTTTANPYVTSKTDNSGTLSSFNEGTAINDIQNFVNNNMNKLLEEYLNPTLSSVTNQAKMNSFMDTLGSATAQNVENNIVSPLSNRNMIRSSQATNMYNNLIRNSLAQVSEYANNLLSTSQKDTASALMNLMLLYMNGYNILNDAQKQSLITSQGNSTKTSTSGTSSPYSMDTSQMMQLVTQMAMLSAGL